MALVMVVDSVTLLAALVCGAICTRIVTYRREGARYRFGVSLCAYVLAAGSGAQALTISLGAAMARHVTPVSPWMLAILLVLLALTLRSRGNVARIWSVG